MEDIIKIAGNEGSEEAFFFTSADSAIERDVRLWNSLRNGSRKALDYLFQQYSSTLFAYGTRFTRDRELVLDAIQDLFVELWNRRQNLGSTTSIKFYLLKSLRRRVARAIFGVKRFEAFAGDFQVLDEKMAFSAEHFIVEQEATQLQLARLQRAIEGLTKRQRECIYLKFFQGLDNQSIASVMDLTAASVSTLLSQAISALRVSLQ